MSTRRPRIKAVAALPPRRKNAASSESTKSKPQPTQGAVEQTLKSPGTPRTYSKSDDKGSPGIFSPPPLPPVSSPKSAAIIQDVSSVTQNMTVPSETESPKVNGNAGNTTPVPEKAMQVSVITPTPNFKNKHNVFISPRNRSSPDRRALMSPPATNTYRVVKTVEVAQKQPSSPVPKSDNLSVKEAGNITETLNKTPSSASQATDLPDDYSIPSVPDSVTEETVMDGIVPLQPEKSAPKPIDLLKNDLISEHAQVLFDPIVPLPSPSKVRPKLRPVPRLAPHRRNSIQGSASESEDESRRGLTGALPPPARQRHDSHHHPSAPKPARIRNDSVSSTTQTQPSLPPPATALSPVKDNKHFNKSRRQDMSKRMWRRRRDTVKRDTLTMYDLIFFNPTSNPIVPDQEEMKAKEENAKEAERAAQTPEPVEPEQPPAAAAAPVPQIKLGPNGEIMLDEKSLVIKQSDADRKVSSVVREGTWAGSGSGRYTRCARTADWSQAETVRFYRALAAIGTDFTLMAPLFPDRTRRDLKLKFKKEERLNGAQVDKALRSATSWDATRLLDEFAEERQMAAQQAEKEKLQLIADKKAEKQRIKAAKGKIRHSKSSKALECKMDKQAFSTEMNADDFVLRAMRSRAKRKIEESQETPQQQPTIEPTKEQAESPFATLTLLRRPPSQPQNTSETSDMATLSRTAPTLQPSTLNETLNVPSNIESGSLVVLRVNNPVVPNKTMLQTYISHADGKLTPIALPPTLLNSVVGYMKKGNTNSNSSASCSPFTSPNNERSVSNGLHSPSKRARVGSWDITTL